MYKRQVQDYADIVRHVVQTWNIAARPVTGKAARAQEFLCNHAERVESLAEQISERIAAEPPVRFSWIHDRLA